MSMAGLIKNAVSERLSGDRPSRMKAALATSAAGAAAAKLTYKVLRS
jgi:hypothetical protein